MSVGSSTGASHCRTDYYRRSNRLRSRAACRYGYADRGLLVDVVLPRVPNLPMIGRDGDAVNLRILIGFILLVQVAALVAAVGQSGYTVAVCFSEFPNSSCGPLEAYYGHSLALEGPVPESTSRAAELYADRYYYFEFRDVPPGNYILRTEATQPGTRVLDLYRTAGVYGVHLVAVGDAILNAEADWPLCDAWGFV